MGMKCTICVHPQKTVIEELMIQDVSNRRIVKQFDEVTDASLLRHKKNHFNGKLQKVRQELALKEEYQETIRLENLVSISKEALNKAVRLSHKAEQEEKHSTMIMALSQIKSHIECINGLARQATPASVHYHVSPEWISLQSQILKTLQSYPEAKEQLLKLFNGNGEEMVSIEGRREEIIE